MTTSSAGNASQAAPEIRNIMVDFPARTVAQPERVPANYTIRSGNSNGLAERREGEAPAEPCLPRRKGSAGASPALDGPLIVDLDGGHDGIRQELVV